MTAFVICNNDDVRHVALGDEEFAMGEMERLKLEYNEKIKKDYGETLAKEYIEMMYWHMCEVDSTSQGQKLITEPYPKLRLHVPE